MTKFAHPEGAEPLIDLGVASTQTMGSIGTQIPDGSLMQFKEHALGLSAD